MLKRQISYTTAPYLHRYNILNYNRLARMVQRCRINSHFNQWTLIELGDKSLCTFINVVLKQPVFALFRRFDVDGLQGRNCNQIIGIAREVFDGCNAIDATVCRHWSDYLRHELVFLLRKETSQGIQLLLWIAHVHLVAIDDNQLQKNVPVPMTSGPAPAVSCRLAISSLVRNFFFPDASFCPLIYPSTW